MSKHLSRVSTTDHARIASLGAAENAIRDAHASGHTVSEIAAVLGVKNRSRVYAILGKPGWTPNDQEPQIPVVVHLRTRKRDDDVHDQLAAAFRARGWVVEPDYMRAWHLARAGVRIVMVDASAHLHSEGVLQVGHIRALYGTAGDHEYKWVSLDEYPTTEDGTKVARWVAEHIPAAVR